MRVGAAEALPFEDDSFDAALSSLVVAFMRDAAAGAREMARVTRPGGVVASCMWDIPGGGMTMLSTFWRAVRTVEPERRGRAGAGRRARRRDRRAAATARGSRTCVTGSLATSAHYEDFGDFWEPFTFAVGPAGSYLSKLPADTQEAIRREVFSLLGEPAGAFDLDAHAWYARGTVP